MKEITFLKYSLVAWTFSGRLGGREWVRGGLSCPVGILNSGVHIPLLLVSFAASRITLSRRLEVCK